MVNPDILILDEVLSVGDGAFRKKSESKMKEIIGSGATTILVSHSIEQVRSMCNKILWLDHGNQICFSEDTNTVCDAYEEFLVTKKIPVDQEAITKMASEHAERLEREKKKNVKAEHDAILAMLNKSSREVALSTAQEFLNQQETQPNT